MSSMHTLVSHRSDSAWLAEAVQCCTCVYSFRLNFSPLGFGPACIAVSCWQNLGKGKGVMQCLKFTYLNINIAPQPLYMQVTHFLFLQFLQWLLSPLSSESDILKILETSRIARKVLLVNHMFHIDLNKTSLLFFPIAGPIIAKRRS